MMNELRKNMESAAQGSSEQPKVRDWNPSLYMHILGGISRECKLN